MKLHIGDVWFGKDGTPYEGIQGTIEDITERYVQVRFKPALCVNHGIQGGKPLGKRHFLQHFTPDKQLTIFDDLP